METPPAETFSPRRSQRTIFGEIPSRMGALTMNDTPTTGGRIMNNNTGDHTLLPLVLRSEDNIPSMLLTPSPSPDELVIQQRSRRRLPVAWSPDIDRRKREGQLPPKDRTPVKHNGMSPNSKSSIVLRSTPRKRLLLSDPMELSPDKRKTSSPNSKKLRLERPTVNSDGPVDVLLKGLTSEQLIGVFKTLIGKHPELEEEVKQNLPPPDIRPLEDQLNYLKKNIFKSLLPNSRLTSRTDSPAFSRAATHVNAFKKSVTEQGRNLVDSQQWLAVLEYVLMAWNYVKATPLWDNPPHNAARRSCFKTLAAQCMMALKCCQLPVDYLEEYYSKIQSFASDSEDIQTCIKYLEIQKIKN